MYDRHIAGDHGSKGLYGDCFAGITVGQDTVATKELRMELQLDGVSEFFSSSSVNQLSPSICFASSLM
jgi:hypothetical protein